MKSEKPAAPPTGGSSPIQSLSRGLAILSQFNADNRNLSLTELSRLTGLHRATVYRFVKTLENEGYLVSTEAGSYAIGPAWAMQLYSLGSDTVFARDPQQRHPRARRASSGDRRARCEAGRQRERRSHAPSGEVFRADRCPRAASRRCMSRGTCTRSSSLPMRARRPSGRSSISSRRASPSTRLSTPRRLWPGWSGCSGRAWPTTGRSSTWGRVPWACPSCAKTKPVAVIALIVPVERFTDDALPGFIDQLRAAAAGIEKRFRAAGEGR